MAEATPLPVDPALAVETDGTFAGLLSAYAEAFRRGALPASVGLRGEPASGHLFGDAVPVATDAAVAARVEGGLERAAPGLAGRLFRATLSERPGIEVAALRLADAVRAGGAAAAADWTFAPAREIAQAAQRVGREAHRMEAFVRFEERGPDARSEGDTWVALVRPEQHVLPLLGDHFAARYPTLAWRIVDDRRGLALVHTPTPARHEDEPPAQIVPAVTLGLGERTDDEEAYQRMWRAYFRAVTIPERRNLSLHLRHVPRRYWPYLTEKQSG